MDYTKILNEAHVAGMAAGEAAIPTAMVVSQRASVLDDNSPVVKSWHVPEGVCGFAYVITNEHGNGKFVKHLKKSPDRDGDKYYYGGYYVKWVREFGQSYERKIAYAGAYASVLNDNGIKAYSDGRLD
tara:strand:- start:1630 stop:2013 length:384 start_codon:yes stop_codon:yes gene_type:complete